MDLSKSSKALADFKTQINGFASTTEITDNDIIILYKLLFDIIKNKKYVKELYKIFKRCNVGSSKSLVLFRMIDVKKYKIYNIYNFISNVINYLQELGNIQSNMQNMTKITNKLPREIITHIFKSYSIDDKEKSLKFIDKLRILREVFLQIQKNYSGYIDETDYFIKGKNQQKSSSLNLKDNYTDKSSSFNLILPHSIKLKYKKEPIGFYNN